MSLLFEMIINLLILPNNKVINIWVQGISFIYSPKSLTFADFLLSHITEIHLVFTQRATENSFKTFKM